MNTIPVTLRDATLSISGEIYMLMHGCLTVANAKKIILTRLDLANQLTNNHIVLLFHLRGYSPKFASSPFYASGTGFVPVSDDNNLESFLKGPTVIEFILLIERNSS
jgi:hypothetical protein